MLFTAAGFEQKGNTVQFSGEANLNKLSGGLDPSKGVTLDQALTWFTNVWAASGDNDIPFFDEYKKTMRVENGQMKT